jgi:hypothetical protein
MANATVLHHLKASAQYKGEAVQRVVDRIARALLAVDEQSDGLAVYQSNAITTTGAAVKASAGKVYAVIIEPDATGATGTGGTWFVQLYNAASVTNLVPGAGTALTQNMGAIKFVTGMTRCVTFDPAEVGNTALFSSGISFIVATAYNGSTAVASLPRVTIVYA